MDRRLDGWIETPRDQETERGKEMRSMNAGSGALNDCRHDGGQRQTSEWRMEIEKR